MKTIANRYASMQEQISGFKAFLRGEPVEYLRDRSGNGTWLEFRGNDEVGRDDIIRPSRRKHPLARPSKRN
jgi:hypothetical protein